MIGDTLKHYKIEQLLGKGGMGEVYRARDTRLNRPVAIKILKPDLTANRDRKLRFIQEARAASAVIHPAIAQVYDVDEDNGILFIAMEFVEGKTISQLILDRELDLLSAVEIVYQITDGLKRAHETGIIHRDIKSDNLMVTKDGHAKLLDFGLAKPMIPLTGKYDDSNTFDITRTETLPHTQAGMVMGTIAYMSPEQARGQQVNESSDIFSVGIVIYEMVTGKLPFRGDSPLDTMHSIAFDEVKPVTVVKKNLPPELHRIVSKCLRKQPQDRYQNAGLLAADLKRLKKDIESGIQRPIPPGHKVQELTEGIKSSIPYGFKGIAAAVVIIGLILFLIFSNISMGSIVSLSLIGLLIYRYIKNRKPRMINQFTAKISKYPEVKAITVRDNLITVIVIQAQAKLYLRINSILEMKNKKLYFGKPLEVAIRDDLNSKEFQTLLREPGIVFVEDDVLKPEQ